MYLKRIELNGFKSFPNKKELALNCGITGVVGPNGSGKSNIADALRWVLGEQSAKNLRGDTMHDVIFNGTQSRSKKGYCEVSLIFDNTDRRVDSEFTEISVGRKMYRSGESEFYINGAGCRLKDILELFRDTGIGKEGYSIIGQGRIDELLTSKPTQRRKVFEEAAGIMKYRVRKEEAERNLIKAKENISRIDDRLIDLEEQVEPLAQQMQEAKSYLALRERIKALEINQYLYQSDRADERIEKLNAQILESEQEYTDADAQLGVLSEQMADIRAQQETLQQEIETHNARLAQFATAQEKQKGEMGVLNEREKAIKSALEENKTRAAGHSEAIEANSKKLEEIAAQVEAHNAEIDSAYAQIQKLKESLSKDTPAGEDEKIAALREKAEMAREHLQGLDVKKSELAVKLEMADGKQQETAQSIAGREQQAARLKEQTETLSEKTQALEQAIGERRSKFNELARDLQQNQQKSMEGALHLTQAKKALSEQQSRYQLLKEMRDDYDGYFDSVKALLKEAEKDASVRGIISGVLAEEVQVPKKLETPIEVALGNAMQNIVVKSDEDAKVLIEFLRANNLGRATFLPTQSLKVKYLEQNEKALLSMPGVLGVASEAIKCSDAIRPAVDFLLARTVITEDMDSAIALMRRAGYAFRAVTMQGDIMRPGGVITGGSLKATKTGLLSRKRMSEELKAEIAQNEQAVQAMQQAADEYEKNIAALKRGRQALLDGMRADEISLAELKQQLGHVRQQYDEHTAALRDAKKSAQDMQADQNAMRAELDDLLEEIEAEKAAHEKLSADLAQCEAQRQQRLALTMEMKEKLSSMELAQTELSSKKNMLVSESQHLRDADMRARQDIQSLQQSDAQLLSQLEGLAAQRQRIKDELSAILEQVTSAGQLSQDQLDLKNRLARELEEAESRREDITAKKNKLIGQKYSIIANKEKTEVTKTATLDRLWDDYELTYGSAQELREDFAPQAAAREIESIKDQLREMGSVNPNAIEDYAKVKERFDYLQAQRADLGRASEDLQVVIDGLLTKMQDSFRKRFALINKNFTRVFGELFGGGTAYLQLLDDGDVMECGIEIVAEPPGKKLQTLTLLSGGEKALTAIALLFAMLAINPSPVCLLDEIDAPLDDANVVRLSEYLQKLSDELQFIVITHRKPTMAICDMLYGVAMQEKGISDIVSVKMN